ncbi:MAG: CotH kinase family protein [Thermomicrobiales bacterium]|nr:CotH kinase family protein [Thermomicrobiales bacterium]
MITKAIALQPRVNRRSFLALSGAALALGAAYRWMPSTYAQDYEPSAFLAADTVHDISIEMDRQTFEEMVTEYQNSGDKLWIEGTVTINGSVYEQSGLRLKGNSSLATLLGGSISVGGNGGGGNFNPNDDTMVGTDATPAAGDTTATTGRGGFNMGGNGGETVDPTTVDPVTLPWLIKLDEYVQDQEHEGMTQMVIRSNNSETSLNEAVALNLLDKAGLASQQAAMVRFVANDSEPDLRLAIENPKNKWMKAHFPEDGLLFKAEAGGDWSYRGDNWEDYADIAFDLEAGDTGDDAEDYVPLISFLDFLNNSEDADFIAELPDRLQIKQFAIYLAMMDLIGNTDDIDGAGNNSYLYWNRSEDQFTVVPWDMNLAFGGMGMMGQGGGQNGQFPTGQGDFTIDGTPVAEMTGNFPQVTNADGTPIAGEMGTFPQMTNADGTPVTMTDRAGMGNQAGFPGGNGGGFGGGNILVTRFLANDEWSTLKTDTSTTLQADLFTSGVAQGILDQWVALLEEQATDMVSVDTIEQEASSIASFFQG